MKALIPTPDQPGLVASAEVPEPDAAPDEAVVEVAAFSVNRGETFLLREPRPGWRPGKDIAGVVVRAAADGSGPEVGTRVIGHPESAGWAELAAVPTSRLARLPDSVALVTGAALPLAGLTALRLIRTAGPLPGVRVLLTGASGGVGHYFTELAAAQGALVTAVSASAQRGGRLRELGAAELVTDIGDAGRGFEVAIESVGGTTTRQAWHALNKHGLLIWFGQASGQVPALDFLDWEGPTDITIRKFQYMDGPVTVAADLATLVRLVATQRLHPEIGLTANWDATGQAIEQLLDRSVRGNAVLTIGRRAAGDAPAAPRAVIERYVAAINSGDERTVTASFAPEAVWRLDGQLPISGEWAGRDQILGGFFAAARSLLQPGTANIEITSLLEDGEHIALEWTSRATAIDGEPYLNRCAALFTIREGRITAVNEYMDTAYAERVASRVAA